jgi:endonuclease/exonuclease/phosphatase family metal-dependent hydrolase
MTFNIRYGRAPDGRHAWIYRRELVVERIRAFMPDLLGLQECRDDEQADYIRSALPGYQFIGFHRGGQGEPAIEMAPLLVRRAAADLLESGCFWLSQTPQIPGSSSWGTALPRTVTWARVVHDGKPFLFMNAHYDHASAQARNQSSRVILEQARQIGQGLPLVVCGDFNARKTSLAYRRLVMEGGLQDVCHSASANCMPTGTFHAYGALRRAEPIDWILFSPPLCSRKAEIDRSAPPGCFASDHYPLVAILEWDA